jgi:hypothetical protein
MLWEKRGMMFASRSVNGRACRTTALVLVPAIILILSSCPTPIDISLASQVEDQTPPIITIVNPDLSGTYYYPAVIVVEGIVTDSADSAGKIAGTVKSLHYEE